MERVYMEPYMGLIKFRGVHFDRTDEDEFIVHLTDEAGNIVMTMEPQYIDVGKSYMLKFPNTMVTGALKVKEA
jgi:hypothetical protein